MPIVSDRNGLSKHDKSQRDEKGTVVDTKLVAQFLNLKHWTNSITINNQSKIVMRKGDIKIPKSMVTSDPKYIDGTLSSK
jgi:hypothetical protein